MHLFYLRRTVVTVLSAHIATRSEDSEHSLFRVPADSKAQIAKKIRIYMSQAGLGPGFESRLHDFGICELASGDGCR